MRNMSLLIRNPKGTNPTLPSNFFVLAMNVLRLLWCPIYESGYS
jgi:hypothetical protein